MLAPFALRLPFKMFDGIRDVDVVAGNAGFDQGFVEQSARGSDEGMALQVLLIAGLLADEDNFGVSRTFAEYGLRGALIEVTAGTAFGGLS